MDPGNAGCSTWEYQRTSEHAMAALPETRSWMRARKLAMLLVVALSLPALAHGAPLSPPPEPRWLLAPRLPSNAQAQALPPGMAAPAEVPEQASDHRIPRLAFTTGQRAKQPVGYFPIKDPCAQENLNHNDEPLSQRINCQGLGVPSGWFQLPNARHPR